MYSHFCCNSCYSKSSAVSNSNTFGNCYSLSRSCCYLPGKYRFRINLSVDEFIGQYRRRKWQQLYYFSKEYLQSDCNKCQWVQQNIYGCQAAKLFCRVGQDY